MTELLLVLAVAAAVWFIVTRTRERRSRELAAASRFDQVRRVADEDVTRFGEELQQLHIDTLTTELDTPMRQDYQRALDCYEQAKELLRDADVPEDISGVTHAVEDGRYAQACVLARQAGEPLPQRRPPCFFNPAHGPAQTDVDWAPVGGVKREIPVCLADADRIAAGAEPDSRRVRVGDRMVPWYEGGRTYAPYADGYWGAYAAAQVFPAYLLAAMMVGTWNQPVLADPSGGSEDWSGGWGDGGTDGGWGGSDGGWGGSDGGGGFDGGFDGSGFDGGGFDGGGF